MQGAISRQMSRPILVAIAGSGVFVGLLARAANSNASASAIWTGVTLPVLAALVVEIVTRLRRGDVGLDMVAAVSMSGALALNEPLAAAVVAMMYAGGQSLESFASGAPDAR